MELGVGVLELGEVGEEDPLHYGLEHQGWPHSINNTSIIFYLLNKLPCVFNIIISVRLL